MWLLIVDAGAIAGIVVGVLLFILLIIVLLVVFCICLRRLVVSIFCVKSADTIDF